MLGIKFFEILFFAIISVVLINRLLSILGEIEEDDHGRKKKFTKDPLDFAGSIIDVTDSTMPRNSSGMNLFADSELMKRIAKADRLLGGFVIDDFLNGAKIAFKMLIESGMKDDQKTSESLVDKRYFEEFMEEAKSFVKWDYKKLAAEISDVNVFGNNVMVKVKFSSKDRDVVTEKFWTFSKSAIVAGPEWYLSNIDDE